MRTSRSKAAAGLGGNGVSAFDILGPNFNVIRAKGADVAALEEAFTHQNICLDVVRVEADQNAALRSKLIAGPARWSCGLRWRDRAGRGEHCRHCAGCSGGRAERWCLATAEPNALTRGGNS